MGDMHVYFKYVWKKRRYIHVEWIFCFRKAKRESTNKIEKRILPSQIQRIEKARGIRKGLQMLCDSEDDHSSDKSFISARSMQRNRHTNRDMNSTQQKKSSDIDLTDSSSEDMSYANKNSFNLSKRNKQSKNERDQEAKSIRDSCSAQKVSSSIKEKNTSKKYKISSDSNNDSIDTSSNETEKRTIKCNEPKKIVKHKRNNIYSSDSESDENDINRASSVSKRNSKDTRQQNKKIDNTKSKDKIKKYDSTSESEDEKQNRKKRLRTSRTTSHSNNDERKHDESSKQRLFNIQEGDSDNSSSKEFQKVKLQKVNRNKYSMRQLVDLEVDHTKSPITNSANVKSDKDIKKQSNQNLKDVKKILKECKEMCSSFQMYIESIEQLCGKENEEQLILKSTEKIDKLKTTLEKKQEDLTTLYQLSKNRKKSATKRSNKEVSHNEQSSEECEKPLMDEDKHISSDGNKAVSECDSEIFSADETRSQKKQDSRRKVDTSRTENSLNNNRANTDDEDRMSINDSRNNDKNNVSMQDDSAPSPVLSLKEKKTNTEYSCKKQLSSECNKSHNKTQLADENTNAEQASLNTDIYHDETENEEFPSKYSSKKVTDDDGTDQSNKRNIIDESVDMFDTSAEDAGENRMEVETNVETNRNEEELLHTSKDKPLDSCNSSLRDKISSEKERSPLSSCDNREEKDLLNQDNEKKVASESATNEEVHDDSQASGKTSDDNDSLDDAEVLAKKLF